MSDDSQQNPNDQKSITTNLAKDVHWITHATFWSQIGLGVIGIVALIIYHGQLCEMQKSTTATQQAAYAACLSAKIANDTFAEVKASGNDSHNLSVGSITQAAEAARAYAAQIEIKGTNDMNFHVGTNQPLILPLQMVNVGDSAALNVRLRGEVRIIGSSDRPRFTYGRPPMNFLRSGVLFKSESNPFSLTFAKDGRNIPLLKEQSDSLSTGTTYSVAYLRIDYNDVFGVSHWTTACFSFQTPALPITGIKECAAYSKTDTNFLLAKQTMATLKPAGEFSPISCKIPD